MSENLDSGKINFKNIPVMEWIDLQIKETLIKSASGMKCKAHGAQQPRHIKWIGEVASTAQRSNSPAQTLNQRFPKYFSW